MRLGACRQLLATILVSHPRRDELTPLAGVNFKLLDPSTSKATNNWKVFLPEKRVKWIVDRHLARIAGIILGRGKAFRSHSTVIGTSCRLAADWNCLSPSARLSSTLTRKALSIVI